MGDQLERQRRTQRCREGFKWSVAEDLIVQASVGRDIGPAREEKRQFAFKFGVQLLR